MRLNRTYLMLVAGSICWLAPLHAEQSQIQIQIPQIETSQYHRPYVAVWIEDDQQRAVKLVAVWRQKPDWLKDLRRFWRKIGRSDSALVDAMSGATQKPGDYNLQWDGKNDQGEHLAPGSYTLFVEAAREQGGRTLTKHSFDLPANGSVITMSAEGELGPVSATIR